MNWHSNTRWWHGVNDAVHPLCRSAHASVAHGRYIYVLNGYTSTEDEMCLFDRVGLTRFDTLTNSVHFLPVHWDYASVKRHGCSPPFLNTSGVSVAIRPGTPQSPACIYAFAGFSLLDGFHTNILVCYELPNDPYPVGENLLVQVQPPCCRARVVSGHGLLTYILSHTTGSQVSELVLYTTLRGLQRRLRSRPRWHARAPQLCRRQPSPRDKLCMEYWCGRLYAFGGYGPKFRPPSYWPLKVLQWPFLHETGTANEWFPCEQDRGWNSQLLIYDLSENQWILVTGDQTKGQPPSARAAHQSAIYADRGWLFIFGGRGPPTPSQSISLHDIRDAHGTGRLNDLYCLNLQLLEWTRVTTPLDLPDVSDSLWPCGRSWMGMALMEAPTSDISDCIMRGNRSVSAEQSVNMKPAVRLFIVGGFSNSNEALSDAYFIQVSSCITHEKFEARVLATTEQAADFHCGVTALSFTPPIIVDGFQCPTEPVVLDEALLKLEHRSNHQMVLHTNQKLTDCICAAQNCFMDTDTSYHSLIYNQLILHPQTVSTTPAVKFTQPFFHISRLHTDLTIFLLCNFCLYDVCLHSGDQQLNSVDPLPLANELDSLCVRLLNIIQPVVQVLSHLIRLFVRFMLPWEPVMMVLRETGAWLPHCVQHQLLQQLSSEFAAAPTEQCIDLILSTQATLDKLCVLMPVNQIHIPTPFYKHVVNTDEQLSHQIQHTILSLLLWAGRSPLSATTQDLDVLPRAVGVPSSLIVSCRPSPRFWHTVTYALDGCFYVIGGSTAEIFHRPVECYRLIEPINLTDACLRQLVTCIFDHCLGHVRNDRLTSVTRCRNFPKPACSSSGYVSEHRQPKGQKCVCLLCTQLRMLTNPSIDAKLSKWLM
ncbi:hypothetical protein P879_02024 [Paragonimus westermani]|uniref:Kelch domain-containing protein 2 n=1 Tax=Paragonimus westermani TaxID=34504 RepID=A0A8T0DWV2_9TREM|nr:hypothetical protein P879_02024 [Paragonimus westermani]